ncbi:hypothetical protein ABTZ21_34390 [Streptomyces sp. NPDC096191]|uniref:hypothetical protein n=1 Tax=Streptomyces sp. NPDC096191 TaxID=3155426 RepID=UPI003329ED2A
MLGGLSRGSPGLAEASVRHWTVAFKAVQEGHTLLALRNFDAAVFCSKDTPPANYRSRRAAP